MRVLAIIVYVLGAAGVGLIAGVVVDVLKESFRDRRDRRKELSRSPAGRDGQ